MKIKGYKVVQDEYEAAQCLQKGETIARFEFGNSMYPILKNGEYAILHPIKKQDEIKCGTAVFCWMPFKGSGYYMTHLVTNIRHVPDTNITEYQISSTDGVIFGWTDKILAVAESTDIIEPLF